VERLPLTMAADVFATSGTRGSLIRSGAVQSSPLRATLLPPGRAVPRTNARMQRGVGRAVPLPAAPLLHICSKWGAVEAGCSELHYTICES